MNFLNLNLNFGHVKSDANRRGDGTIAIEVTRRRFCRRASVPAVFLMVILSSYSVKGAAAEDAPMDDKLNADQIVAKASLSAYYGGDDGRTLARMRIVDANGRKQSRQFTILRKDLVEGGEQKFLVVFSRPSDVKGTAFMVHKKPDGEDDRWLYLPALDLVKRISAGDKRTSFVGTHYFYEDVSGRSPKLDTHQILEETDSTYILQHRAIDSASVEFESYKTWIDKVSFLPLKIEYYDGRGNAFRRIEALEVKLIEEVNTVTKAKVSNLSDGSFTLLEFRKINYNLGFPDNLFSERSLRTPPVNWLKTK